MASFQQKSLEQIVHEANGLAPGAQQDFVRQWCDTDSELYSRAMAQLGLSGEGIHSDADLSGVTESRSDDAVGEIIGSYRLVRRLGEGGMGVVFLAERVDDQFRQHVAIKLVRRNLVSRHVEGRLRLERQILATLDHPNIARLFDGGTTTDGTPYIVMEYIDGEPIDTYCDKRRLPIEGRLRLFRTVCSAVHRAHQNLIVHRDLKPSNILVTADGIPKLLDFGIAKLLDDQPMMHTMAVTQADYRVMTPDHASPEQIRGEPVTTASDIYVLGVLLYELLCGYRPFSIKARRLAELERAICEDTPTSPSEAIASRATGVDEVAADRGVSAAKLRRQLSGDLDNIIAMAMRKEPQRRYSSAEQLSADIAFYLEGKPVLARADTWAYRASKFVQRHAVVVGLSAAFLSLLMGFSVTTYTQSQRLARERDLVAQQRTRAETERGRAEEVSLFLRDLFKLSDPSEARGNDVKAREILDRGALRVTTELRRQPELQATLLDTIGQVYLNLGLVTDAQPLVEQAFSIRRALFGPDNLVVATSLSSLADIALQKGELEKAETYVREGLAINSKLTRADSLETAGSRCYLGVIHQRKSELAEAERYLRECLKTYETQLGDTDQRITIPLDNLARVLSIQGDYTNAEQLYRKALTIDRATVGQDHPGYIQHLHNLATVLQGKGEIGPAEELYEEAIAAYRRVLGAEHPETIDALSNYGLLKLASGELDEAARIFANVVALNRKARGDRHVFVGQDIARLAEVLAAKGQLRQAEQLFQEALTIYQETWQADNGYIATALMKLGRTFILDGQAGKAEPFLRRALTHWNDELGVQSFEYGMTQACLGKSLAMQGEIPEGRRLLEAGHTTIVARRGIKDQNAQLTGAWLAGIAALDHRQ